MKNIYVVLHWFKDDPNESVHVFESEDRANRFLKTNEELDDNFCGRIIETVLITEEDY